MTNGSDYIDYLQWWGTRDPSAYLSVPAAIQFQADHNWNVIQEECHELAIQAVDRICKLVNKSSLYGDNNLFHQMAIAPLPKISDLKDFKETLFRDHALEIPCIEWNDKQFVRISIQGYNSQSDIDALIQGLEISLPKYCLV
jgi:isopenicillin-N epimerase